jgi:PKHD-type hydroxylase
MGSYQRAEEVAVYPNDTKSEGAWKQQPTLARTLPGVLSRDECEAVKKAAFSAGMKRSLLTVKGSRGGSGKQSRNRTSYQAILPRTTEMEWLYARILALGEKLNTQHWKFAVTGIETLQVLRYSPMQRFRWHYDSLPGRKITCVVNLSAPGSHWRGRLQVKGMHEDRALAPRQGSATAFPSYLLHRATAPWWGERWSLVAWLTGPPLT